MYSRYVHFPRGLSRALGVCVGQVSGCGSELTVILDKSTVAKDSVVPHHQSVPRGTRNQLDFIPTSEGILQYIEYNIQHNVPYNSTRHHTLGRV